VETEGREGKSYGGLDVKRKKNEVKIREDSQRGGKGKEKGLVRIWEDKNTRTVVKMGRRGRGAERREGKRKERDEGRKEGIGKKEEKKEDCVRMKERGDREDGKE